LLQLRIDSACQQLQCTDASIGTIAQENGFYDQSALTACWSVMWAGSS
jgi:AraC-like DNA-binding protein